MPPAKFRAVTLHDDLVQRVKDKVTPGEYTSVASFVADAVKEKLDREIEAVVDATASRTPAPIQEEESDV